jgi:hypothetical protein
MQLKEVHLLKYNGNGNGNGYGNGDGDGDGDGYGDGNGDGYGNGYGDGNGNGLYMAKIFGEWFEISGELENSLSNNLPPKLYNVIDKEFLQRVTNLESLRSLREKIGLEKYISLFNAKVINEEIDYQGNQMKLYKYDEKGTTVILLEVICPSTKRMYHLYPPNQKSKTCTEAKSSTFNNRQLFARHGDVGIFKVDCGKISIPFSET